MTQRLLSLSIAAVLLSAALPAARPSEDASRPPAGWLKGNLHLHSDGSDGIPAVEMARWYEGHGYDFVFFTDHNLRTDISPGALKAAGITRLKVFPGEELSGNFAVHCNVFNARETLFDSIVFIHPFLQLWDFFALAEKAGVPVSVNHPNYQGGVCARDLMALPDLRLFELINEYPGNDNDGDSARPSTERVWDSLLSAGKQVCAVGGDDAHGLGTTAWPGGVFVVVRTSCVAADSILGAILNGRSYVSSGPMIEELRTGKKEIRVRLRAPAVIDFIGTRGRVLKTVKGTGAALALDPGETYVRVRMTEDSLRRAWTQPVFLKNNDAYRAAEKDAREWAPLFHEADKAYNAGRDAQAESLFIAAQSRIPAQSPFLSGVRIASLIRLAAIHRIQGRPEAARADYGQVAVLRPAGLWALMVDREAMAPSAPRVRAARVKRGETPVIDGRGDDPAWTRAAWEGFRSLRDGYRDTTLFKVLYDDSALYVCVQAALPDTHGLKDFLPLVNENISLLFDPARRSLQPVLVENRSPGVTARGSVSGKTYLNEYRIPFRLLAAAPPLSGSAWGFNMARIHQKFGSKKEGGWSESPGEFRATGWTIKGGESVKPSYFGLLLFD